MTIWKDSAIYPDNYEVSDEGGVRSKERISLRKRYKCKGLYKHVLKPKVMKGFRRSGYTYYSLTDNGKRIEMQGGRLVLMTFVGEPPEGTECCHGDGDRLNNRLSNLRWDTRSGNMLDAVNHGTRKTGEEHPFCIYSEKMVSRIKSGEITRDEALSTGMDRHTYWRITRNLSRRIK